MVDVVHQPQLHCFTIDLEGQLAKLEYHLIGDRTVEFTSTHVPFSLRGKGFGEELVKAGLGWAYAQGLEVQSRCWYVDKFLTS